MDNLNLFGGPEDTGTPDHNKELSSPKRKKLDSSTNKQINNTSAKTDSMSTMSAFGGTSVTYDQDEFNRKQEEVDKKYDSLDDVLGTPKQIHTPQPQQEPKKAPVHVEKVEKTAQTSVSDHADVSNQEQIPKSNNVNHQQAKQAPVNVNVEKIGKAISVGVDLAKSAGAFKQVANDIAADLAKTVSNRKSNPVSKPVTQNIEEVTEEQEIPHEQTQEAIDSEYRQDLHSDPVPPRKPFIKQILDGDQAAEDKVDFAIEKVNYAVENVGKFAKDKFVSGLSFVQNVKTVKKFKQGDFVDYLDLRFLRYNNELMLYKYNGTNMSLEIPSYVGNLPVTQINPGFLNFVKVKSVAKSFKSDNIQYTSASSLKDCVGSVKSIKLPNTLEVLPAKIFSGCRNLRYIIVPASVQMVHSKTFAGCYPAAIYFEGEAPVNLEYCDIGRTKIFCRPEFAGSFANIVNVNSTKATEEVKEILFGEMS